MRIRTKLLQLTEDLYSIFRTASLANKSQITTVVPPPNFSVLPKTIRSPSFIIHEAVHSSAFAAISKGRPVSKSQICKRKTKQLSSGKIFLCWWRRKQNGPMQRSGRGIHQILPAPKKENKQTKKKNQKTKKRKKKNPANWAWSPLSLFGFVKHLFPISHWNIQAYAMVSIPHPTFVVWQEREQRHFMKFDSHDMIIKSFPRWPKALQVYLGRFCAEYFFLDTENHI